MVIGQKSTPILINLASIERSGSVKMRLLLLGYFKINRLLASHATSRDLRQLLTHHLQTGFIPLASFENIYLKKASLNNPRAKEPVDVRFPMEKPRAVCQFPMWELCPNPIA